MELGSWTLVAEVRFDTDPNSPGLNAVALDEIERTVREILTSKTTMSISGLRVVPKPAFA
ncbi:hypothetical protein [Enterovirga sp. CN4-39]|uniref:hypothetical protein n=1 Tax=Enterovirga sp. CN4-39 TaxID=3400910 RepID=UPI003C04D430